MEKLNQTFINLAYDYSQFTILDFTDYAAGFVRKEILLRPYKLEKAVSGVWVSETTAHYIFYNDQHPNILRIHTILHEIAHIVLNHKPKPVEHYLDSNIIQEFKLSHSHHLGKARIIQPITQEDPDEQEAEEFVFLIQHQLMLLNRTAELFGDKDIVTGLRQFTKILE